MTLWGPQPTPVLWFAGQRAASGLGCTLDPVEEVVDGRMEPPHPAPPSGGLSVLELAAEINSVNTRASCCV